ncbi:MAG: OadG family protein [Bacteroidales bacterium]|nr:OadG family protein [Bacteroidales bacterium]
MKNFKYFLITLLVVLTAFSVQAQSIVDLRLNEVLIKNDENFTDEYGRHVAWVEIFNTAYNSVNVGGCYLTNDTTGLAAAQKRGKAGQDALNAFKSKCYNIPSGDPKTLITQRSSVVFFLDGDPTYGTFHVSFKGEESNYIALLGSDGRTLIDILELPADIRTSNKSFGCEMDGIVSDNEENTVVGKKAGKDVRQYLDFFTPGSNNKVISSESKADKLAKNDPHGIAMALTSMSIVFGVLFIIFLVLKVFAYYSKKEQAKKEAKEAKKKEQVKASAPASKDGKPTDEELAAITAALHQANIGGSDEETVAIAMALYFYLYTNHDYESEVLTFGDDAEHSTWAQKHFNFKQNPSRRG